MTSHERCLAAIYANGSGVGMAPRAVEYLQGQGLVNADEQLTIYGRVKCARIYRELATFDTSDKRYCLRMAKQLENVCWPVRVLS